MDLPKSSPGRAGKDRLSPHRVLPLYPNYEVVYMSPMDILQIIGSYGFPIAMCMLIYFDNRKLEQEMRTLISSNTAAMTELTAAVKALGGDSQ